MKRLICSAFPLIPHAQVFDSGRRLRQRFREFGLVLLHFSAGDLFPKKLKLFPQFRSIGAFIPGSFLISSAQFYKPLLHVTYIHAGKLPLLQFRDFLAKGVCLQGQFLLGLLMGFPLRRRQVLLASQIGNAFLQPPDLLPAALETALRRENRLVFEMFPHGLR